MNYSELNNSNIAFQLLEDSINFTVTMVYTCMSYNMIGASLSDPHTSEYNGGIFYHTFRYCHLHVPWKTTASIRIQCITKLGNKAKH